MGGFKNKQLNQCWEQGFYKKVLCALVTSCKLLVEDCQLNQISIPNNEEKIRTYLLENYLENDQKRSYLGLTNIPIRFDPEVLENYNAVNNTYTGRTDIRIVSTNWFRDRQDYYIVECKRLDGTNNLNQRYIDDGVCRFTGNTPKYSSYHKKNIMLGFIVANVKPMDEANNIDAIHKAKLSGIIVKDITHIQGDNSYCLCESQYTNKLTLHHILYNISTAVS